MQLLHNGVAVGVELRAAFSWFSRALGLLIDRRLSPDKGLWLKPCSSVHTLGMAYAIDVVFLDRTGHVKKVVRDLKPFRMAFSHGADSVMEFKSGMVKALDIRQGDHLCAVCEPGPLS